MNAMCNQQLNLLQTLPSSKIQDFDNCPETPCGSKDVAITFMLDSCMQEGHFVRRRIRSVYHKSQFRFETQRAKRKLAVSHACRAKMLLHLSALLGATDRIALESFVAPKRVNQSVTRFALTINDSEFIALPRQLMGFLQRRPRQRRRTASEFHV